MVAIQKANEYGCRFGQWRVTGTDCHLTGGRSLSIVRWRQLPFPAKALKYSQIIMTVVFGPQTKQQKIVIASSFILISC